MIWVYHRPQSPLNICGMKWIGRSNKCFLFHQPSGTAICNSSHWRLFALQNLLTLASCQEELYQWWKVAQWSTNECLFNILHYIRYSIVLSKFMENRPESNMVNITNKSWIIFFSKIYCQNQDAFYMPWHMVAIVALEGVHRWTSFWSSAILGFFVKFSVS